MVIFSSSSGTTHHLSRPCGLQSTRYGAGIAPWARKNPGHAGASLLDWQINLPIQFPLLLPLSVGFLFTTGGAGLSVSSGCDERLAADLADLLEFLSPFLLA